VKTILTFDLGGSSMRLALFDMAGNMLDLTRQPLSMEMDSAGGCEADPEVWWLSFVRMAAELLERNKGVSEILAVCGSGMTRSQVFVDKIGTSVFQALLWPDHRSDREGEFIAKAAGPGRYWSEFNAFHTLARVLWLKRHHPNVFDRVHRVLEPKDFLNYRLTGQMASDRISLARILRESDLEPDRQLMGEIGISPDLFPELKWPWQRIGHCRGLTGSLALLNGAHVLAGAMDTWCSVTGTGVFENEIYNVSGTSEVTGLITTEKLWRKGLVTLPWGEGRFQVGGPSQIGGDALQWLADLFIAEEPDGASALADLAEGLPRSGDAPLFIPYLRGERAPLWDKQARGVFWNLNREHRRADLVRAVMEGVAMANRYLLEILLEGQDFEGRVILSGKAASSDLWCQIKADVLGLSVVRRKVAEAGLTGAFILAMKGTGNLSSLDEGRKKFAITDRTFVPDSYMVRHFNQLYPHWKAASLSLLALHRDLQRIRCE
jgi:xylulokinase